jgi:hypothetical protein
MENANARLSKAIGAGKGRTAFEDDTAFYSVFIDSASNAELTRILGDLKLRLRRLEVGYFAGNLKAADSVREHEHLLAAFRRSDIDAAVAAVEANWRRSSRPIAPPADRRRPRRHVRFDGNTLRRSASPSSHSSRCSPGPRPHCSRALWESQAILLGLTQTPSSRRCSRCQSRLLGGAPGGFEPDS